jgi:hypothetical protein
MNATKTNYTVKTNYGWGWSIPEAPECPHWGSRADAQMYADLRNRGLNHEDAWDRVQREMAYRDKYPGAEIIG